ncbi:hypothetical protein JT06_15045 [Desulfobulbus sp. Tol-SR]|jgi:hypothetical protein|nr:hypothetical protein JT06_15045 [Desulfobulbus sp. Tol-SR]
MAYIEERNRQKGVLYRINDGLFFGYPLAFQEILTGLCLPLWLRSTKEGSFAVSKLRWWSIRLSPPLPSLPKIGEQSKF